MSTFYLVLWLHFFGDFVFQTDNMAKNKSSSLWWLSRHVLTYIGILFLSTIVCEGAPEYALVNGVCHFYTDLVTSKMTRKLMEQQRIREFFMVIGLDQVLHLTVLYATLPLLSWRF